MWKMRDLITRGGPCARTSRDTLPSFSPLLFCPLTRPCVPFYPHPISQQRQDHRDPWTTKRHSRSRDVVRHFASKGDRDLPFSALYPLSILSPLSTLPPLSPTRLNLDIPSLWPLRTLSRLTTNPISYLKPPLFFSELLIHPLSLSSVSLSCERTHERTYDRRTDRFVRQARCFAVRSRILSCRSRSLNGGYHRCIYELRTTGSTTTIAENPGDNRPDYR